MGPDLVVIHFPLLNDLFGVFDGNKLVGVENIFSEGSVKTLHNGILLWFPFLNGTPRNLSIVESFLKMLGAEFWPVVCSDPLGGSVAFDQLIQIADDSSCG